MIRSPKFLTFPNYIFDNFETHFGVSNFWGLPPSPPSKIRCLSKIRRKIGRCLIANCSAHRPPTEMSLYFLESPCPDDSKSTASFLWDVCELSNSRLKSFFFIKIYRKFEIHENVKMINHDQIVKM